MIRRFRCKCGIELFDTRLSDSHRPGEYIVCIYCAQLHRLNDELRGEPIRLADVPDPDDREFLKRMQIIAWLGAPAALKSLEQRRRGPN